MLMSLRSLCVALASFCVATAAFSPPIMPFATARATRRFSSEETPLANTEERDLSDKVKVAAANFEDVPKMNPDRPELPQLKGDYDWDAKFSSEEDWITSSVPGKIVVNEIDLATQVTALNKLEEKWKRQRMQEEYDQERLLGWTEQAEMYNGRFAMFFLVVGLLTEYWTGINFPGQVEEMLRVAGVIGFEG